MTFSDDQARRWIDALVERAGAQLRTDLDALVREVRQTAFAEPPSPAYVNGEGQPQSLASAVVTARVEERQADLATASAVLEAMAALDGSSSLSDTLDVLVNRAAVHTGRVLLVVKHGGGLMGWRWHGYTPDPRDATMLAVPLDDPGLVARAAREGVTQTGSGPAAGEAGEGSYAENRAAIAVPLQVGGTVVAVLYADEDGGDADHVVPSPWPEVVEVLARHAARCVESMTAQRVPELVRAAARTTAGGSLAPDEDAAQRYARLLVAEIRLYHEGAVEDARREGDILRRLRPQIERAQQLYAERVGPALRARTTYFEDELVRTLAAGDAALLGEPT